MPKQTSDGGSSPPKGGSKKRRGRPLKEDKPLEVQVSFRLDERSAEALKDYCWRHDLSPSEVIRDALDLLSITGLRF
jgi:hypothetical protein